MPADTLLLVHTPRQRFIVSNADVYAIRSITATDPPAPQAIHIALGALFDPADVSAQKRQHGMIVPLRRKEITLVVDHIDMLDTRPPQHALPKLLASRLEMPWSLGAFEIKDDLVIQLDLRAIARNLLIPHPYGQARQ